MRSLTCVLTFVAIAFAVSGFAEDTKQEAITKDRMTIKGTWRVTELHVNGNKAKPQDARKITVINGSDGTWAVRADGKVVSSGTSSIDPTAKPKTIDFLPTEGGGKGKQHHGIYELGINKRRLCFASHEYDRPTDFVSRTGSQHILVTFERVDADPDGDAKVSVESLPSKAQAGILRALHDRLEGFLIREIEAESEGGRTIYDVEIVVGGQEVEVEVSVDGDIVEFEIDDDDEEEENEDDDDDEEDRA